ncbi:MAG: peptidylprolyl isomerase [Proteobacteria bacterium]|nr:peptidylprolyl isomerase [Pseudomonadota bacterium]
MKVENRRYVTIEYSLSLDSGEVVDQSSPGEPLGFLFGTGQVIRGLEKGLEGLEAGATAKVTVEARDGYGEPNPALFREIPRENFPEEMELQPGMGFEAKGPHGPVTFRVREVRTEEVVADFNHPLAGERLHFDVKVEGVREPRAEELAQLLRGGCDEEACGSCGGGCGG